jgi:hypothetical protein
LDGSRSGTGTGDGLIKIQRVEFMRKHMMVGLIVSAALLTGCATPLTQSQKREYEAMKSKGMLVEEKNPGAAAALGILPGGGSFYAREPGIGVVNLLFWPLSVLWDPISGYEGAKSINYDASRQEIRKQKEQEVAALDDKLRGGALTNTEYLTEKQRVDQKYAY